MEYKDIKIGQMVKRTIGSHGTVVKGDIRKITELDPVAKSVRLEGDSEYWHDPENLEPTTDTEPVSLKHTDISEGNYYHVTTSYSYIIIRCDSKDDDYRWTGPTISIPKDEEDIQFEDGTETYHGAHFGGEYEGDDITVRYATEDEVEWLDECIDQGELVEKPTNIIQNTMEITKLTPDLVGKRIKCKIEGTEVPDAKIQFEREAYYICQNVKTGTPCNDRLGYKHSWKVRDGSPSRLSSNSVREIYLFTEKAPVYLSVLTKDMVGKKITCKIDTVVVTDAKLQLHGDYWFVCNNDDRLDGGHSHIDRLGYEHGWSIGGISQDMSRHKILLVEDTKFKPGDEVMISRNHKSECYSHFSETDTIHGKTPIGVDTPGKVIKVDGNICLVNYTMTDGKGSRTMQLGFRENDLTLISSPTAGEVIPIDPELLIQMILNDLKPQPTQKQ